jgi:uncharacterized protein YkwD
VHHAPAGPSLLARAAGFLARARFRTARLLAPLMRVIGVLRRMRVLPLALAALTLGAFAVAAPLAPYDDARDTSALTSTAGDESGLVPATGDGWTQDGAPAVAPPPDAGAASSSSSSSSSSPAPASSPAAVAPADTPAPVSDTGSSPAPSPEDTPAPSASAPSPSEEPEEPAAPTPADPEVTTTAVDPAGEVLAAVNDARTSAGCEALTADAGLASLAAEHSARMRDDHEVDAPSSGDETWAVATGSDPTTVAGDWLGDDDLLDCDLTSAGVGAVDGFWTLVAA